MIEPRGVGKFAVVEGGVEIFIGGISDCRKIQGYARATEDEREMVFDIHNMIGAVRDVLDDGSLLDDEKLEKIQEIVG